MPRRSRQSTGQLVFHVLNRAVQDVVLFNDRRDYQRFLDVLVDTIRHIPMRILAYALMPNHWHLVLWPFKDGDLAAFMKRLTATHAQLWRQQNGSRGRGAVYQGRYKAIAVQNDLHLVQVCRYVERNPLRARLVASAQEWPWTSAAPGAWEPNRPVLAQWPVRRPDDWLELLNTPEPTQTLHRIRSAVRRGRHFGTKGWRVQTAHRLSWREGDRGPGRRWEVSPREYRSSGTAT